MDSFKRHPRIWAIVGIVFVTMPQWAGSIWNLFVVDKPMVPTLVGWIGVKNVPSPNMLGWVPTVVGLVLLVLVWEQTRERRAVHVQPQPSPILGEPPEVLVAPQPARPPEQLKRASAEDDKIFIEKSVLELVAPFNTLTDYKAKKLVEDYYNTWVRWTLTLSTISQHRDHSAYALAAIPDGLQLVPVMVTLSFAESDAVKLLHLDKDTMAEIEGQVEHISTLEVRLVNCRLLTVKRS